MERLSRIEYYEQLVKLVAQRATCPRAQVGVVAIIDNRVVATGYNGAPKGMDHCHKTNLCLDTGCKNSVHAEANCIAFAARHGIKLLGATMICTHSPCVQCAQLIVNAGITNFCYVTEYRVKEGLEILDLGGVYRYHLGHKSLVPEFLTR